MTLIDCLAKSAAGLPALWWNEDVITSLIYRHIAVSLSRHGMIDTVVSIRSTATANHCHPTDSRLSCHGLVWVRGCETRCQFECIKFGE